jgi:excisionase family DNA binding protein
MPLSLRQAAVQAGTSKTTILRAIKSGKLSAGRTDGGGWAIEPSELFRVYPPDRAVPGTAGQSVPGSDQTDELVAELRAQLVRMDRTLDDVREDRDRWRSMAERLTLAAPQPIVPPTEPAGRLRRAWRWMRKAG